MKAEKPRTLAELDLRPGDVVKDIDDGEIGTIDEQMVWRGENGLWQPVETSEKPQWVVVRRAARPGTPPDDPERRAAAAIRAAVSDLNAAILEASNLGLRVEIETIEMATIESPPTLCVVATTAKIL